MKENESIFHYISSIFLLVTLSDSLILSTLKPLFVLTFLSSLYRSLCDGVVVWVSSFGEFRCGSVLVLVVFERQRRAMA